ncbi:MAG: S-layer homology domain-containing protein [Bryobacterales bacterium]|nr:S-layer homology domain-containing protein [Bryobacterales bacterium]
MPVPARASRARIRLSPSSLRMTVVGGRAEVREVAVTAPEGVFVSGGSAEFLFSSTATPGKIIVNAFHYLENPATSTSLLRYEAQGLPPAFLPVELTLTPGSDFLRPAPKELDFIYTRGAAAPPSQEVAVQSSTPFSLVPSTWDSTWMNATASSSSVTVSAMVTNKPLGTHRTRLLLQNQTGLQSDVYVNFAVNDGPGIINVTPLPELGGTVAVNPPSGPYANGSTVTLTATPAPGFTFGWWSGVVNDTANPVTVTVNGRVNVSASFLSVTGSCTYTLSPPKLLVTSNMQGAIELQTQSGCPWTISQTPFWLNIRSPRQGTGPAVIHYSTTTAGGSSTSFVQIADKILMAQITSCAFARASLPGGLPAAEGTVVLTTDSSCVPFESSRPWLRLPTLRGFANFLREITLQVDANPESRPRTASINVAGIRVPTIQRAAQPSSPYPDVDANHLFADHITLLKLNNAADTCGNGLFCPDAPILREQMAEMLVRSLLKTDTFTFPSAPRFEDVAADHPRFKWIQKLAELGISNGCTATRFCPSDRVTRGQMAAFLVRARAGVPAGPATGNRSNFVDFEFSNIFGAHIDTIRRWGVTVGCYSNAFCPDDFTTRGQMAAFLVRAFFTP